MGELWNTQRCCPQFLSGIVPKAHSRNHLIHAACISLLSSLSHICTTLLTTPESPSNVSSRHKSATWETQIKTHCLVTFLWMLIVIIINDNNKLPHGVLKGNANRQLQCSVLVHTASHLFMAQHVWSNYFNCASPVGVWIVFLVPALGLQQSSQEQRFSTQLIRLLHGQEKIQSLIFSAFLVQSFPLSCLGHTEWGRDLAIIWYNLIKIDGKSNNARHKVTRRPDCICADGPTAKPPLECLSLSLPS